MDNLTVLGAIQVNVRVRIAEISRQVTRQLGFNWQALGSGPGWRFGLLSGAASGGAISPLLPLGLPLFANSTAVPNQLGAGFTSGNKLWDVNGIIDALAADQLITILAEPNLTALSGETANFLAGGEFPIPIAGNTSNGATTITVEFKTFGISLAVVPTVLSPTRVNLRVRPEVSQLSTNGAVSVPLATGTLTIPALTVRRAETTIELGSGQSFAIAGLLQKTSIDQTNALPWIGEVPVIGALFKSNDFQRGESELVIIVTPYVVQPASSPTALRTPVDGFRPATDLDRILLGRQQAPGPAGTPPLDAGSSWSEDGMHRFGWLIVAVLATGCTSDLLDPFQRPRTWTPSSDNDANLRVMVANPHDLVEGVGQGTSAGAEAAPPVARDRWKALSTSRTECFDSRCGITTTAAGAANPVSAQ